MKQTSRLNQNTSQNDESLAKIPAYSVEDEYSPAARLTNIIRRQIEGKRQLKRILSYFAANGHTYDPPSGAWKHRKSIISDEEILKRAIYWSRENNHIEEHGVFAEQFINEAKKDPKFIMSGFMKNCTRRCKGKRVRGIEIISAFCKYAGIEIDGSITDFVQKNSLFVGGIYQQILFALGKSGGWFSKRLRIFGQLCASVFGGLEIIDESEWESVSGNNSSKTRTGTDQKSSMPIISILADPLIELARIFRGSKPQRARRRSDKYRSSLT